MVAQKKKGAIVDKAVLRHSRFFHCALSGTALKAPLVCDRAGLLYSREALLQALLAKAMPAELGHVRALSDVFAVQPTRNPEYTRDAADPVDPDPVSPWVCPVTGKDVGTTPERMVANPACGCVFAQQLAQQADDATTCYHCGGPMSVAALVELAPSEEQLAERRDALMAAAPARKKKKAKKAKKMEEEGARKRERDEPRTVSDKIAEEAVKRSMARMQSSAAASSLFASSSSLDKLDNTAKTMRYC